MKTILSLFDTSGEWSQPYWDSGNFDVVAVDLQNWIPIDVLDFSCEFLFEEAGIDWADGILAAPPCTDFTNSGARWWRDKDSDGRTNFSIELVLQALRTVELLQPDFWVLENPVGRLPKLVPELGKPRMYFDPCDFAGWIATPDEEDRLSELRTFFDRGIPFEPADLELVMRVGAYTKKTALWGEFDLPEMRRIEPVRVCAQGSWLQRLGGSGQATKNARSVTPAGFSMAFAHANSWEAIGSPQRGQSLRPG